MRTESSRGVFDGGSTSCPGREPWEGGAPAAEGSGARGAGVEGSGAGGVPMGRTHAAGTPSPWATSDADFSVARIRSSGERPGRVATSGSSSSTESTFPTWSRRFRNSIWEIPRGPRSVRWARARAKKARPWPRARAMGERPSSSAAAALSPSPEASGSAGSRAPPRAERAGEGSEDEIPSGWATVRRKKSVAKINPSVTDGDKALVPRRSSSSTLSMVWATRTRESKPKYPADPFRLCM